MKIKPISLSLTYLFRLTGSMRRTLLRPAEIRSRVQVMETFFHAQFFQHDAAPCWFPRRAVWRHKQHDLSSILAYLDCRTLFGISALNRLRFSMVSRVVAICSKLLRWAGGSAVWRMPLPLSKRLREALSMTTNVPSGGFCLQQSSQTALLLLISV